MDNTISDYIQAKENLENFDKWVELVGKAYKGGGGGVGKVHAEPVELKIVYQEHHGSQKYHPCPKVAQHMLGKAIRKNFEILHKDVRAELVECLETTKTKAVELAREILNDAQ